MKYLQVQRLRYNLARLINCGGITQIRKFAYFYNPGRNRKNSAAPAHGALNHGILQHAQPAVQFTAVAQDPSGFDLLMQNLYCDLHQALPKGAVAVVAPPRDTLNRPYVRIAEIVQLTVT